MASCFENVVKVSACEKNNQNKDFLLIEKTCFFSKDIFTIEKKGLFGIVNLLYFLCPFEMYRKIVIGMVLLGGFFSFVSAASWSLPGVNIITRAKW